MKNSSTYDVIVVGGGPAGAMAARTAAEGGLDVLLLEEHSKIGRPIQCTGLLSLHGIDLTLAAEEIRLRPITGAFVYGPDGRRISLGGQRLQAYVIDRDRLDQQLIAAAKQAGVAVKDGVRAVSWRPGTLGAQDLYGGKRLSFKAPLVIGADGAHSRVAGWAGLGRPKKNIYGLQVLVPHQPERDDFVDVWIGRDVAPDFFAWAVPAGKDTARVGLGSADPTSARRRLERLLGDHYSTEIISQQGGTIPIGIPDRTVADGVMLVGDAAGQAKPTSGGGIYTGSLCGQIAGQVAVEAVCRGDVSAGRLEVYERRWREKLERELRFGWHAHRLLCELSDDQIDRVFEWLAQNEVQHILEEYGDIDYPSICMKEIVKNPKLWGGLLKRIPPGPWVKTALGLMKKQK